MTSFYEMVEPTTWVAAPSRFSFSSLQGIEACPRKWQLLRSSWGEHARFPERPHPKALEGSIVHKAIELLIRALGKRGLPSTGSPRFREAVEASGFWAYFAQEIEKWNARLASHPRSGPCFVLRMPPRELANRAIRLFREQYTPLDAEPTPAATVPLPNDRKLDPMELLWAREALSEYEVEHPDLPFGGIIDLVELVDDEVTIVDFKTGKQKDEHELQLQWYAVLWWRCTGIRPTRLAVQYLNRRREIRAGEHELLKAEEKLEAAISNARSLLSQRPAPASPGSNCGYCPVRARCVEGWALYHATLGRPRAGTTDIEVLVVSTPSPNGFLGKADGREVDVVYDITIWQRLPDIGVGDKLRLLEVVTRMTRGRSRCGHGPRYTARKALLRSMGEPDDLRSLCRESNLVPISRALKAARALPVPCPRVGHEPAATA